MMSYTIARGLKEGEKFNVVKLCQFTTELGLDALDWVTTHGYNPKEIRRITDEFGLKNICYTFRADLNFPTPEERAEGRDEFKRGIETAVTLGADKVMLPVGGKKSFSRQESFRNVVEGLKEVIDFAKEAGVVTTIENFPHRLSPFITSQDVNCAVEEVPDLRITFDNGNVITGGEKAEESFRRSAPYVIHSHFKDYKTCSPDERGAFLCLDRKYRRPVLVGDGDVNQPATLQAMKDCHYTGYINFEYQGLEYTPHNATREGIRRLRDWIAGLK